MKNVIFTVLMLCLCSSSLLAQIHLKGRVFDEKGNPLVGAEVYEKGASKSYLTDEFGRFSLQVKQQATVLVISFLGYETLEMAVSSSVLECTMKPKAWIMDEVIVSGIRAGERSPVAHTDLSKLELEERAAGEDIPYLLSMTPSVVASSETGAGIGYSSMRIRGTEQSRINVTINGIPLNDSESQDVFWVNLPNLGSSVDALQVQRGVGTSTNGAAAFGANVNFQTAHISEQSHATVESTVGAFNTYINSLRAGTGLLHERFTFDFTYSKVLSEGYIDHTFSDHQSLMLSTGLLTKKGLLKMNILSGDQRTGISWWGVPQEKLFKPSWAGDDWKPNRTYNPAGEYTDESGELQYYEGQTDNYKQTHYQLFYSHAFQPEWKLNTAVHYTQGSGYYEQYKEDEDFSDYGWSAEIIGSDTLSTTDLIRQKWLKNHFYGFTSSLHYSRGKIDGILGGGWNRYEGDHFGEVIWARYSGKNEKGFEWYDNLGEKMDYNVYSKFYWQASPALRTLIDLQYRYISYDMYGFDDDLLPLDQSHSYHFFNPKAGLFYEFSKKHHTFFAVGVSNREPTRSNFKDAKGHPESYPRSERLIDFELAYHYTSHDFSYSLNTYYMLYKDQLVPTGEKNNVGSNVMTNVRNSYRAGIEAVWALKITPKLRWDGNLNLSVNKIRDFQEYADLYRADGSAGVEEKYYETSDIAYSPKVVGASILSYRPTNPFLLSLESKYVGKQYFDNTSSTDRQLDAYHVSRLKIAWDCKPSFARKLSVQLLLNNIFDLEYESNAYGGHYYTQDDSGQLTDNTWAYYYPQAGRHWMLKVLLAF